MVRNLPDYAVLLLCRLSVSVRLKSVSCYYDYYYYCYKVRKGIILDYICPNSCQLNRYLVKDKKDWESLYPRPYCQCCWSDNNAKCVHRFHLTFFGFQIGKRKYDFDSSEVLQGLDFFGNKKPVPGDRGALRTHQELQDEEKKEESQIERKKEQNRKKKKKKMTSGQGLIYGFCLYFFFIYRNSTSLWLHVRQYMAVCHLIAFKSFQGVCDYKYCYSKDTCKHIFLYRCCYFCNQHPQSGFSGRKRTHTSSFEQITAK